MTRRATRKRPAAVSADDRDTVAENLCIMRVYVVPNHSNLYNCGVMHKSSTVGLISGTGDQGHGIALRLAAAGNTLSLGSRSAEKAGQTARLINQKIGEERVQGMDNHELVSGCEILFLTVPFAHVEQVINEYRLEFSEGQILVDVTVPVVFDKGPQLLNLESGSGAEHLQRLLPAGLPLVAAFKTLPAHLLGEIDSPLACDEFICSDSSSAKTRVLEVVSQISSLRWIDAGGLRYSRCLEAITLLEIALNRRYKVKEARVQVVGL